MAPSDKYQIQAELLSKAIDIANEALLKFPPKDWPEEQIDKFIDFHEKTRNLVLFPQSGFRNLTSLKYGIDNIFTFFQEGGGEAVEYFWSKIKEESLPFKRENKMVKILKRKKINNIGEYDFIIDTIVPYQQEGFITEEDVILLNQMIDKYEQKMHKK